MVEIWWVDMKFIQWNCWMARELFQKKFLKHLYDRTLNREKNVFKENNFLENIIFMFTFFIMDGSILHLFTPERAILSTGLPSKMVTRIPRIADGLTKSYSLLSPPPKTVSEDLTPIRKQTFNKYYSYPSILNMGSFKI